MPSATMMSKPITLINITHYAHLRNGLVASDTLCISADTSGRGGLGAGRPKAPNRLSQAYPKYFGGTTVIKIASSGQQRGC
jgi:hypothetical protein